jgi:hypothetical protein
MQMRISTADSSVSPERPSDEPGRAGGPASPQIQVGRAFDDEWRRWIGENLLLGADPASIIEALAANGFAPQLAAMEIDAARRNPYLRASQTLQNRLKKRDWILACYRKLERLRPGSGEVERRQRPSRDEFLRDYYASNRPVIITGAMDDWPAMTKWSLDYFAETFGDREVDVQMNRDAAPNYEINSEQFVSRIRFGEFARMVRDAGSTNNFYMTANNNSRNRDVLPELWQDIREFPEYLRDDMPASRFFWLGPRGTITPFHHDLTNNFMAQVIGRKLVKLVPSWDMPLMMNFQHVFSRMDGRVTPAMPSPAFQQPQVLECVLNPGEVLFLPIGCMHFVEGLEVSVTVSFTSFAFDNDFSSFYETYGPV